MTEAMLAAVVCPIHGGYKEGAVCIPVPDADRADVHADTEKWILPLGQTGEICIRDDCLLRPDVNGAPDDAAFGAYHGRRVLFGHQ